MHEMNAILAIAYRDIMKFVRDRMRMVTSLIFPVVFVGVLGGSLQENLSSDAGYSFIVFAFTGVIAQTLFQATANGVISIQQDRDESLVQEMFVSPISRYSIIVGKVVGEATVALLQGVAIVVFGFVIGVPLSFVQLAGIALAVVPVTILGGSFGVLVLSQLKTQQAANQIFPFIMLPQFFLAGVFSPIKELPAYLWVFSRAVPLTYAVDFVRGLYYAGMPAYDKIVLHAPVVDVLIMAGYFTVFIVAGTYLFVRNERNT